MKKLMKAADMIYKNNYRKDEIVKMIEGKKGAKGGASHKKKAGKKGKKGKEGGVKLEKRLKNQEEIKKKLLQLFGRRLQEIFDRIASSANTMVKKLGTDIPLTDGMRRFVNAFCALQDLRSVNVYYALSGFSTSTLSKEIRERYIGQLRNVIHAIDEVGTTKAPGLFRDLKGSLVSMIELIHDMVQRFPDMPDVTAEVPCDTRGAGEDSMAGGYDLS